LRQTIRQAIIGQINPKKGCQRMANIYNYIGEKIQDLRTSWPGGKLSQEGLAEKLGIAANTVSRWETGTYKPTAEDLDKLARLFKVSITVFFPDLQHDDPRISALTSATGGLDTDDFEEVIKYAEFRKARKALEAAKRPRAKR
jgi:transcriptional regulator with XRE-family HTH domain